VERWQTTVPGFACLGWRLAAPRPPFWDTDSDLRPLLQQTSLPYMASIPPAPLPIGMPLHFPSASGLGQSANTIKQESKRRQTPARQAACLYRWYFIKV
jgi:hypothetical protein